MLNNFSFVLLRTPLNNLKSAFKTPDDNNILFQEGIYLSSKTLFSELEKERFIGKSSNKMDLTLSKYWIRCSTRSTPYGTFAGSSIVTIKDEPTKITLREHKNHYKYVRLDMTCILRIILALNNLPLIYNQVNFFVNNSLYSLPHEFRYAEFIDGGVRKYQLTSFELTDYFNEILEMAEKGVTIKFIVETLIKKGYASEDEANQFILELIKSQVLVSDLDPCITGNDPLDNLIIQLEKLNGVVPIVDSLKDIQKLLNEQLNGVKYLKKIDELISKIPIEFEVPQNTIQTDLFPSLENNVINSEICSKILEQANDLMKLSRNSISNEITQFIKKFKLRFEDNEVSLNLALDSEVGIGYAGFYEDSAASNKLIDDLAYSQNKSEPTKSIDHLTEFAVLKYTDYLKDGLDFISISEQDLQQFVESFKSRKFPSSMYLIGSLLSDQNSLSTNSFTFDLNVMGGPSAGNILGRFTHGNKELLKYTRDLLAQEEKDNPDAIYAEIVHLPQARIGNVILRPILRKYEIPYVGNSGIDIENQITIADLYVGIKNDKVYLRSKKHNKIVIPRLTNAHNYINDSLPVYKFLCDLQSQGIARPALWDWGILSNCKFLPRVVYKNMIIQKATWTIDENDFNWKTFNSDQYLQVYEELHKVMKLPEKFTYSEFDNRLLINLKDKNGVELFKKIILKFKKIKVQEFLFSEDNTVVKDKNGDGFCNELIIPFFLQTKEESNINFPSASLSFVKSRYSVQSEWLYFKIYCGVKTAEKILKDCILPFVEEANKIVLFEKFFFIRYKDESPHIRIRFYNSDIEKQQLLQKKFISYIQPFIDNGLVYKILIDEYNREINRYGDSLIEEAESLFFNDSIAVLRFLKLLEGNDSSKYKILFSLRGIDMLFKDFNLSLSEKQRNAKLMQQNYFKEFGSSPLLQKQLNEKYRQYQKLIFSHMDSSQDSLNEIEEAVSVFNDRSHSNKEIVNSIYSKLNLNSNYLDISILLQSYVHMFINRLFLGKQRSYELVIYHFLEKYYSSIIAKDNLFYFESVKTESNK